MSAVLSIIGRKGSGKSSVLEDLIARFRGRGYRVGVIKHMARTDFEIDDPAKDTFRYRKNGAETVVLSGANRLALFSNLSAELPIERLLRMFEDFDLVFLEGYFQGGLPKIEVHRKESGGRLLAQDDPNVLAVISDQPYAPGPACFSFEQPEQLAIFLEEALLKKEAGVMR